MKTKEEEFRELFVAEAMAAHESLNTLFTQLEKDHGSRTLLEAAFRITHTLKANAAAMGYQHIADISHTLEDIFGLLKDQQIQISPMQFADLFRAVDKLGEMIKAVQQPETEVRYKGLLAKLRVMHQNLQNTSGLSSLESSGIATPEDETHTSEEPSAEMNEDVATNNLAFSEMVQIPVHKLDHLLNLVGELVIERDRIMLSDQQRSRSSTNLYSRLQRLTSDLQYSVMDARLVQINTLFQKFHRIVRDVATTENKHVQLVLEGSDVEIDRTILQTIGDALIHLVRNAIAHGIEPEQDRINAGKAPQGTVLLRASNERGRIMLEISDDGKGIDTELIRQKIVQKGLTDAHTASIMSDAELMPYIFESGFSSASRITEISGRGVGLDVVKSAITQIGGKVSLSTQPRRGTTFMLSLPVSMAVKKALLFELNQQQYAIPIDFTDAVLEIPKSSIHLVGDTAVVRRHDEVFPLLFLRDLFVLRHISHFDPAVLSQSLRETPQNSRFALIKLSLDGKNLGLVVDKLLQQKEIIEKQLSPPIRQNHFISGATILGSGHVCLVLDVASITGYYFSSAARTSTLP